MIMRRFIPVLLLALLTAISSNTLIADESPAGVGNKTSAKIEFPVKENFHLFLLVGQSNMAGRGKVAEQDKQPHPRVLTLNKKGDWAPAIDPIHFDKGSVGVGLGRSFGIAVAEANPEITVGLIPCAAGGSPIASWTPGGYHNQTKSHPYDDALKRARKAMETGTLKGILWHQGESDSKPEKAAVYADKLDELIRRLRKELSAEKIPFIAGQLGQFSERPWSDARKQVDAAHRQLPTTAAPAAFVPSDGLTHRGDQVHFDAQSYREFGQRYAAAYFKLSGQ